VDQNERHMIDDLFTRLQQAEQQSGPRDRNAEQQIGAALGRQPAAPYYMAQVILMQEQAVRSLTARVQQLEQELAERPAGGGSFLGGLFGGAGQAGTRTESGRTPVMPPGSTPATQAAVPGRGWASSQPAADERVPAMPPGSSYGAPPVGGRGWFGQGQGGGGSFLGSAMQTAAGVAGGMLLANAVSGLFGGGAAHAAGLEGTAAAEAEAAAEQARAAAAEAEAAAARAEDQGSGDWTQDDLYDQDNLLADNSGDFETFGEF
jgi:uncharacterized protein